MALTRNPFLLVPLLLDLLVLFVVPALFRENPPATALLLTVLAMAWPWILYAVIGRVLTYVEKRGESRARQESDEDSDFV